MVRGVILGTVAFAAAFALERLIAGMKGDLTRYDAMRKMSGDKPLAQELLSSIGSLITGPVQKSGVTSFVTTLTSDAVRYAKMKGM